MWRLGVYIGKQLFRAVLHEVLASRGRTTRTNCDDYVVPNVLSPRDLVSRPDNMDETVLSASSNEYQQSMF